MENRITNRLKTALNPEILEVKNNSHLHEEHLEDAIDGETHFAIKVKSEELSKLRTIEAHRKINSLLAEEFDKGLHALEIKVLK